MSPALAACVAAIAEYERHENAERVLNDLIGAFKEVRVFSDLLALVRHLYPISLELVLPRSPIIEGLWSLYEQWDDPVEKAKTLIYLIAFASSKFPWQVTSDPSELNERLHGAARSPLQMLLSANRSALWNLLDSPCNDLRAAAWLVHSLLLVQEPDELEFMLEEWQSSPDETLRASLFLGTFHASQVILHQRGPSSMGRCSALLRSQLDSQRVLSSTFCAFALGHLSGHLPANATAILTFALNVPQPLPALWCPHDAYWVGQTTRRVACSLLVRIKVDHTEQILPALSAVGDGERRLALAAIKKQLAT